MLISLASDGLARSQEIGQTIFVTVSSGIKRNRGATANEAGCIRPKGKNIPSAGRPADGGV